MASLLRISLPVEIPTNNDNLKYINKNKLFSSDEAYEVTSDIFDPYRSSPPSLWNFRLKERLKQFENKNKNKI